MRSKAYIVHVLQTFEANIVAVVTKNKRVPSDKHSIQRSGQFQIKDEINFMRTLKICLCQTKVQDTMMDVSETFHKTKLIV